MSEFEDVNRELEALRLCSDSSDLELRKESKLISIMGKLRFSEDEAKEKLAEWVEKGYLSYTIAKKDGEEVRFYFIG